MSFNYEIKERVAVLSGSEDGTYTVEVNWISYNGAEPKLDIRRWDRRTNRMLKGIALSTDEARALEVALQKGKEEVDG